MKLARKEFFSKYIFKVVILVVLFGILILLQCAIHENARNMLVRGAMQVMHVSPPESGRYYVNTSRCHMPYMNPFSADVMEIYKPARYRKCVRDKDFVRAIFDGDVQQYRLELSSAASKPEVKCCYRGIERAHGKRADNEISLLRCVDFEQNFTVPKQINAMLVDCKIKRTNVQQLAFAFVQVNSSSSSSISSSTNANTSATAEVTRYPNVLIFGIDSLSRANFRRNMPMTHAYLTEKLWYELEGYNKIGDNTYPNVMALLTGYNEKDAFDVCKPEMLSGLDNCKFLWHYFKAQGYRTAYGEDVASIGTFNHEKKGFQRPPTDHYLRPFILAISKKLSMINDSKHFCVGRKHYAEYVFDYAQDFINIYRDVPIFGLFWVNSFSHNDFDGSSSMDERFLAYLRDFEAEGVFEKSIVLFMSDHGMRFGPLRHLSCGFLEARLPVFYISLPPWFQIAHPNFIRALNVNRNRLTSPYDIHSTLLHILSLNTNNSRVYPAASGCPGCQSIFKTVPENRACDDAGINGHWCACESFLSVSVETDTVQRIAKMIITEINNYLIDNQFDAQCATLALQSVMSAERKENLSNKPRVMFRLKLVADPLTPHFEATVTYDGPKNSITLDVESISRLNRYKNKADCVFDNIAKKFCICKMLTFI